LRIKGVKSHEIISQALEILKNLDHRGAVGADPLLGDGAGILIQLPDALLRDWADKAGVKLPQPGDYGVAMCFLPQDEASQRFIVDTFEKFIAKEGQHLIGWRDVPVCMDGLGKASSNRCR
jgi:glutamate synthase (NADPH/NADH) large chain